MNLQCPLKLEILDQIIYENFNADMCHRDNLLGETSTFREIYTVHSRTALFITLVFLSVAGKCMSFEDTRFLK
jgi:hypothetical protein